MKKKLAVLLAALLAPLSIGMGTAGAAAGFGGQINAYTMDAVPVGDGIVGIEFDVSAQGRMEAIGAEIGLYSGSTLVAAYDRVSERNAFVWGETLREHLIPGSRYYIEITVYAQAYSGQVDRRTEGFYVTA